MPLFSNPFDADVEKATSELNTSDDWAAMLDICDKAKQSQTTAKNCLRSIMKRVFNRNPHIALQALSLLNACIKNSGRTFHLEVASREFVTECRKIISEENNSLAQKKLSTQLKLFLKNWSENEFKSDSALSIIPDLYTSLKEEGISFSTDEPQKAKKFSKDPNVVQSQEEEEDIAKAIALSLKESEKSKSSSSPFHSATSTSIYPSVNHGTNLVSHGNTIAKGKEPRKVRALYDFEAVEDNELTFKAGEVIGVIDDSDQNWWKGVSWRGEGLFPANFVTSTLDALEDVKQETVVVEKEIVPEEKVEIVSINRIDEDVINMTLAMLQNADPTGELSSDPENMVQYEEQCRKMLPLIDQELEKIDRQHSKLMEFNDKLTHSLELYHTLMAEIPAAAKVPSTTSYQQQLIEQQMAMMQLQQQQAIGYQLQQQSSFLSMQQLPAGQQQQIPPAQFQQMPNAQYQQIPGIQQLPSTQTVSITPEMVARMQQANYTQPAHHSLSSFAETYLGNNSHQVNINSIPLMTTEDTSSIPTSQQRHAQ